MRLLAIPPLVFVAAFALTSADPKPRPKTALSEPRQRLLKGNYAEARVGFEALAADAQFGPAAAIGIAQSWRSSGQHDKAYAALNDGIQRFANNADLLAARGDLHYDLGKWDEALADAAAAMKLQNDHFAARWIRARILRDSGKLEEADTEMRWFVRNYSAASQADKDIDDPDKLLIVAEAGAENARWHGLHKQFSFILNEVYGDALKYDPDLWQAEYRIGAMLLEKYNRPDAVEAFDKALALNPNAAEPYVGKGLAALQKFEITEADEFATAALQKNPKLPAAALCLKADIHLLSGELALSEKALREAAGVNPRDEMVLGKLAALLTILKKPAEATAIAKQVEAFDSKPAVFHQELGNSLEDRKNFAQAAEQYAKAMALRPKYAAPRTALGMLHLRLGREAEGRKLLDESFLADKFNVRVANMRKVMEHLDRYQAIRTPHYEVKYDGTTDKLLAEFIAEYLEEVHADLKKQFDYEPEGVIPFQVFSRHEMFSGRTVGLPDLHTIGACTGRVVAMASPKAQGVLKPFNWGRVIRHELVHVFNLTQTDYRCPHWLTEGLAVRNEQMKHPFAWIQALRGALNNDQLFNLDTITVGFVRPRNRTQWTLAYVQSHLYVDFMTGRFGEESVAKILKAYAEGLDTDNAIRAACGVERDVFESGYRAHIERHLTPYESVKREFDSTEGMTFEELEQALEADPKDLQIKGRLAERLLQRNRPAEARKMADEVLKQEPGQRTAAIVRARLLQQAGDDEAAIEILETQLKKNPKEARLLLALGRVHVDAKQYEKAAVIFERGRKAAPLEGDWLEQLVRVYSAMEDGPKMIGVLEDLAAHDPDEFDGRLKLAGALLEAKDSAKALTYARQAIQIDITNPEAQKMYVDCVKASGGDAEKVQKRFARKD